MPSAIDATKPVTGNPTTQSVRDQFATAKSEITALMTQTAALPTASDTAPAMDGDAAAGSAATYSRGDHVHPHDTSKLDGARNINDFAGTGAQGSIDLNKIILPTLIDGSDYAPPGFGFNSIQNAPYGLAIYGPGPPPAPGTWTSDFVLLVESGAPPNTVDVSGTDVPKSVKQTITVTRQGSTNALAPVLGTTFVRTCTAGEWSDWTKVWPGLNMESLWTGVIAPGGNASNSFDTSEFYTLIRLWQGSTPNVQEDLIFGKHSTMNWASGTVPSTTDQQGGKYLIKTIPLDSGNTVYTFAVSGGPPRTLTINNNHSTTPLNYRILKVSIPWW